ncbi:MAG TPA: YceI family protein [Bacteroidia bacterium]|nr:YceI family protein [Bacteroidia bacterium]
MKNIFNKIVVVLLIGGLLSFTSSPMWKLSKGHTISFSGKGVDGVFKKMEAEINFDEKNLTASKFIIKIDVNSINTGNALQNKHAIGADWFDAAKYPLIKFTTSSIEKSASGYLAKGKMEVKNKSKEVSVPFTFTSNGLTGKFTANFTIKRSDYGVGESSGDVDDEIKIKTEVSVEK